MVSIEQINAFLCVYELQGYSAAAKKLGKGRTTIRELVLTFEERLDLLLFEIEGRKVIPTASAHKLYPHALLLQTQLMNFSGLTESLHQGEESHITIHYDAILPQQFMVKLTAMLHEIFPHIQVSWLEADGKNANDIVVKNESHISFLIGENGGNTDPRIETFFLGWIDFGIFTGEGSPLQTLKSLSKIEFRNVVQVVPQSMKSKGGDGYVHFSNNYVVVNNSDEICRLLSQLGWAILPSNDVKHYVERGEIKQIHPDFMLNEMKMSMAASYRPEINRGPAMTYLLSLLPQLSQEYFN